jgi:cytochrome c55X
MVPFALVFAAGQSVAEPPDPARQADLLHLLRHDCGSCHGFTMRGGLGPSLEPASLEGKADEALVTVMLDGIPGTPMPPWRSELTASEAAWLVDQLRRGLDAPP